PAVRRARRRAVQLPAGLRPVGAAGRRGDPQPRPGPPRLARRLRGVRGGQGADLGRREDRGHRQRRRSRGRRAAGRRSGPAGLFHAGRARAGPAGRARRPAGRPGVRWRCVRRGRRGPPGRTAQRRQRAGRRGARPGARPRLGRRRAGPARVRPGPAPQRAGRRRGRRPLRRRQQGDQPARRAGLARLVRQGCLGRRWPAQGRAGGRAGRAGGRPARRRRAARSGPRRAGHGDSATRPRPPRGDRLQDRRWGNVRGGGGCRGSRPARRYGAAGAGRRLDGHVPGLQGPRRRVRRGGARAGGPVTATATARTEPADDSSSLLDRPLTSLHLILVSTGLLLGLGLVMVLSASMVKSYQETGSAYSVFTGQAVWVALAVPAFWLGVRLPPRVYRRLAYPALLLSLVLLAAVLVPGVGIAVNGAQRWLDIGPLQMQPAELAKLALALWGADLLVRKQRLLGHARHLLMPL